MPPTPIAQLKREALMAPYRITRLCPGAWSIVSTLTGSAIATERTWGDCMDAWLSYGASFDELTRLCQKRIARLDSTLAGLASPHLIDAVRKSAP